MADLVGHFLLFTIVGSLILLAPLVIGRFVRPNKPTDEKRAIYECGEPTIGSSYIQFDLRFYTVALLFIIFDVEIAFFFPWAMVFGGTMQLADTTLSEPARETLSAQLANIAPGGDAAGYLVPAETAYQLGWTALVDILVFFGVLLVGFAYVWKRGDLDWVRAVTSQERRAASAPTPESFETQHVAPVSSA